MRDAGKKGRALAFALPQVVLHPVEGLRYLAHFARPALRDRPRVLALAQPCRRKRELAQGPAQAPGDEKRGADSAIVEMAVEVRDKKQLERVMTAMRRIPGVRDVERVQ